MRIIGIYEGHNCSACVVDDGRVVAAAEEERFSRIKMHDGRLHGMPEHSLRYVLQESGATAETVDHIAITLCPPGKLLFRILKDTFVRCPRWRWMLFFVRRWQKWGPLSFLYAYYFNWIRRRRIRRWVAEMGLGGIRVHWLDHHFSHAASAYYTSGKRDALIITADGQGDGLSAAVYVGRDGELTPLTEIVRNYSIGILYTTVTVGLGYKATRHEGKITGLAAFGDPQRTYDFYAGLIQARNGTIVAPYNDRFYYPPHPEIVPFPEIWSHVFEPAFDGVSREDISAGLQKRVEDVTSELVRFWVERTGVGDVCLAGGFFANVRVNQEVLETDGVSSVFVFPAMGDGGLAVGGALHVYAQERKRSGAGYEPTRIDDVYWGPSYSNDEIQAALDEAKLVYEFHDDIESVIARTLADGEVVARFHGRMEFGPRALGNRSILYQPTDPSVNDWLNEKLRRTEFMPFAPSTLREEADKNYINEKRCTYPAEFMTITYDCHDEMKAKCPAVVHVDGTARPQLVSEASNASYWKVIKEYQALTGLSSIINTSFNIHEEPIVCSPYDAVRAFKLGHLGNLAIGNYLVRGDQIEGTDDYVEEEIDDVWVG
tara:strand:- start:757 stop:2559 length:1803 start_codon:yes stop_codon:yes gene_type:complete